MKFIISICLVFIMNSQVIAEESNASQEQLLNTATSKVEKIQVTGSRIKRINLEGANPLTIFTKEDLDMSGQNSVADFLRETSISYFGVGRGEANANTGNSNISLKGERTLILLNGLRVATDPQNHEVDLNLIPINAIERIEVLKNGGGSVYGSDAVGGVINFITKKDFSGTEVHASVTPTLYPVYRLNFKAKFDDYLAGSQGRVGITFGDSGQDWSYIGSFSVQSIDNIIHNQRSWGFPFFSALGPRSSYKISGQIHTSCSEDELDQDSSCPFDWTPYADYSPQYNQISGLAQGELNLLPEVKLYTQFLASYKKHRYYLAPLPVTSGLSVNHPPGATIFHRFAPTDHESILKRRRVISTHHGVVDLTAGFKGYLSKTWDYDFSLKGAYIQKNTNIYNRLLKDKMQNSIDENIYDPEHATLKGLEPATYTTKNRNYSSLIFSSFDLSGESGLWGIDLATGVQTFFQNYVQKADRQLLKENILSAAGSNGTGKRLVGSYYLEAVKNFNSNLELEFAWRADYYSDFGLTNFGIKELLDIKEGELQFLDYLLGTPKLAFRYQPASSIFFRGSVSTSFIAPNMEALYGSISQGYPFIFDTSGCIKSLTSLETIDNNRYKNILSLDSSTELTTQQLGDLKQINDNIKLIQKYPELLKKAVIYEEKILNQAKNLTQEEKDLIKTEKFIDKVTKTYSSSSYCGDRQYPMSVSSNKNLGETRALVASLGSVFEVNSNTNLNIDFNFIKKSAIPTAGGVAKKIYDEEALTSTSEVKEKFDVVLNRNQDGYLESIESALFNLGSANSLFMELGLFTNVNNIYYKNDFTLFFLNNYKSYPSLPTEDIIGDFGKPRWINIAELGWKDEKNHIVLKALSSSSYKRESDPNLYFPTNTRFDIKYEYLFSEKTKLNFNIYNFINIRLNFYNKKETVLTITQEVPVDPNERVQQLAKKVDLDIHTPNGTHFTVGVSHLF